MITAAHVQRMCPHARPDIVRALIAALPEIRKAGVVTPRREALFLANVAVETAGLTVLEENLRYTAARLMQVWPKRFPSLAMAMPYALNGPKLAEKVYGSRADLGNGKGDGWPFRGSGAMQTTGRTNFRRVGAERVPDELRKPHGAFYAAARFWLDRGCNALADADDVVGLRRRINGALNGLAEVKAYYAKAKTILGA